MSRRQVGLHSRCHRSATGVDTPRCAPHLPTSLPIPGSLSLFAGRETFSTFPPAGCVISRHKSSVVSRLATRRSCRSRRRATSTRLGELSVRIGSSCWCLSLCTKGYLLCVLYDWFLPLFCKTGIYPLCLLCTVAAVRLLFTPGVVGLCGTSCCLEIGPSRVTPLKRSSGRLGRA